MDVFQGVFRQRRVYMQYVRNRWILIIGFFSRLASLNEAAHTIALGGAAP
jgi:hypothetical protein